MRSVARITLTLLAVLAIVVSGCGPRALVFEPDGAPLDIAGAERLAKTADLTPAEGVSAEEAPEARVRVLTRLRTLGATGDRAATLLTRGFPERTAAIPVLVRSCTVDGRKAIVVVEAYGGPTGPLTHRRMWIFDAGSGAIIRASSYR